MFEYKVWHYGKTDYVHFDTLEKVRKHTGLSMWKIRRSIEKNHCEDGWKIAKLSGKIKGKHKKGNEAGYICINDKETIRFNTKYEASMHTGVSPSEIDYCINDGGCANGWYFDIEITKDNKK